MTDDDAMADILRSLRMHGHGNDKYDNIRIGLASRLDTCLLYTSDTSP